jgi:cobyrinic acid a,c-diamide synthase
VVARIVVAAPASGHGKTTVATGLLAALAARGVRAAGFKVGPDYIDPSYHALACGRPARNLDPVLVGEERIGPLFAYGARDCDVAVVEGVLGLFDGRTGDADFGSTAHAAALLGAPVLLVVDASAQGRSVAALVHGFRSFSPAVHIGGLILNRVGSDRHEQILRDALRETGTPVLGVLRRAPSVQVPSRHLGLVPAAERAAEATQAVAALGALVSSTVDIDAVVALARSAAPLGAAPWSPADAAGPPAPGEPVVAVAGGAAFSFGYTETVELLAAAGARVATVDPLRDEALPEGTAALVVGGGFPEVYASQLAANTPLRAAVAAHAAAGKPIVAECAGLLWLCDTLDGAPMCGVLPASAAMTPTLSLGYRDAVAASASWLAPAGTRVTGHEFHRTTVTPAAGTGPGTGPAWRWRERADGFVSGAVHASYLHLHWAGQPGIAGRLVAACG